MYVRIMPVGHACPQKCYFLQNGFFVECGALDGERSSNSIWLEIHKHWTGLLIEMDPYYYTQLRGKNRKSFSINAGLSTTRHPEMVLEYIYLIAAEFFIVVMKHSVFNALSYFYLLALNFKLNNFILRGGYQELQNIV